MIMYSYEPSPLTNVDDVPQKNVKGDDVDGDDDDVDGDVASESKLDTTDVLMLSGDEDDEDDEDDGDDEELPKSTLTTSIPPSPPAKLPRSNSVAPDFELHRLSSDNGVVPTGKSREGAGEGVVSVERSRVDGDADGVGVEVDGDAREEREEREGREGREEREESGVDVADAGSEVNVPPPVPE